MIRAFVILVAVTTAVAIVALAFLLPRRHRQTWLDAVAQSIGIQRKRWETDAQLRERVLRSVAMPPCGGTLRDLEEVAMCVTGVRWARARLGVPGTVVVEIDRAATAATENAVRVALEAVMPLGSALTIDRCLRQAAPQPWHEPTERDDPDEPDQYGIPRSL